MLRTLLRTRPQVARFVATPIIARSFSTINPLFNSVSHKINTESTVYKYLQEGPQAVKYTNDHEWLAVFKDDSVFLGITRYAADALGDVTYVELPEVGDVLEAGDVVGSVESVKSASDIYAPVGGEVVAINENLNSEPGLINIDPQGEGWLAQLKITNVESLSNENLLTEQQYDDSLEK